MSDKRITLLIALVLISGCAEPAQHRTAQYVKDHHCVVDQTHPSISAWDDLNGKPMTIIGWKAYKCPTLSENEWINIHDNEEQP